VQGRDGVTLRALTAGERHRPTVLLINALGISGVFLAGLAAELAPRHHVVTWESRGLPDFAAARDDADYSVERHVGDAAQVLAALDVKPQAIVSYCSGSPIAAMGLARGQLSAQAWCAISPSIHVPGGAQTDYQRTMLPMWAQMVKTGHRHAALVRGLIRQQMREDDGSLAHELHHYNNRPFLTVESTYRYAQLQSACLQPDWPALLARIDLPALIVHAGSDDVIHRETSMLVARHIPHAEFAEVPGAGHFAIYDNDSVLERIGAFLRQAHPQPAPSH
uniref:alpha/beta fold hydrolase n=1 Tax=Ramlibacter sp. TaxID=1917967 RepID=UPI0018170D7E